MSELKFQSAGVSLREIDLSGADNAQAIGVPAGVIGTANEGPAFVPVTVATFNDFAAAFGDTDGEKFGPLAVFEWLRNALGATYLRVLGIGKGEKRRSSTPNPGSVEEAGFVVGEEQPNDSGNFGANPNANDVGSTAAGAPLGRTYFLGAYMKDVSTSVEVLANAFDTTNQDSTIAHPIIRGVLMAASGVVLKLSSSTTSSAAPSSTAIGGTDSDQGAITGSVDLSSGKQEFVMLLNGHKGQNPAFPNVLSASFDITAPNHFSNIFNTDPLKLQDAGYLLYTRYDIHPALVAVTGTGLTSIAADTETEVAFLTTGSADRNTGTATVPSYESFEDRFAAANSPWVISQKFGGSPVNLFKVEARSDGAFVNDKFKISIENIANSSSELDLFGSFDIVVRSFDDNDDEKVVLESYRGCKLDPTSDQFVAKVVGDKDIFFEFDRVLGSQKLVEVGSYPNKSRRIRIVLADDVDNGDVDPEALPVGFRGPRHLVTSGSDPLTAVPGGDILKRAVEPPVPFRENLVTGVSPKQVVNRNFYWGVQFQQKISATETNKGLVLDETVRSFTKYFPNFHTSFQNVHAGDNAGATDVNGTILDSDRFNNNQFSLEKIRVVTGSDGKADLKEVEDWAYVRAGNITTDDAAKTRALDVSTDLTIPGVRSLTKFSFFIQGGFDGVNIFNEQELNLGNRAIIEEMNFPARGQDEGPTVRAFRKGLTIMQETSDVDINLLAIPGIRHSVITDAAITTAETRFDALYIMDIEERDTLNSVVTSSLQDINITNTVNAHVSRNLDSSFGAAYFPDVILTDPTTNTRIQAPPSVAALGALALNDAVSFPWFAPAGFTRGALSTADQAVVRLKRDNMDALAEADINPIVAFPGGPGVTIWGQRTLLAQASSLDRVNVRRLLLDVRRRVRNIANNFLFEPNRADTLERFSNQVSPVLQRIQEQAGIERFRVRIDTETTTQADVDNNTIRGFIVIQPTRSAEFVALDFVVTNAGVQI